MTPKFADPITWQQAELLMQPAFIRVIDNIRKQLEQSNWKGNYRTVEIWPEGTTAEMQANITDLQQQLAIAPPSEAAEIEQTLAQLPQSYQGYELHLEHQGHRASIDLWELCYQICFRNYESSADDVNNAPVEIDTTLIDETGEVDWQRLDTKTKQLIERVFTDLTNRPAD